MRDLYQATFAAFSRFTPRDYFLSFVRPLPVHLLEIAASKTPVITRCRGFDEVLAALSAYAEEGWRNPELYPHLMSIQTGGSRAAQREIAALRTRLGLAKPVPLRLQEGLFWRPWPATGTVWRREGNSLVAIAGGVLAPIKSLPATILYRPVDRLFGDVAPHLYRGASVRLSSDRIRSRAEAAMQLISEYCPVLSANISRSVGILSFTSDKPEVMRSFSLRNYFPGAVFSSLGDPAQIAENLVHEYYHREVWRWWLVDCPADMPHEMETIISPITGEERSVQVMIHALMIYRSVVDFYQFHLDSHGEDLPDGRRRDRMIQRSRLIKRKLPDLANALSTAVSNRPKTRDLVQFLLMREPQPASAR